MGGDNRFKNWYCRRWCFNETINSSSEQVEEVLRRRDQMPSLVKQGSIIFKGSEGVEVKGIGLTSQLHGGRSNRTRQIGSRPLPLRRQIGGESLELIEMGCWTQQPQCTDE